MRIDRFTLLHGLRSAALRERDRRQAADEARAEEAREWLMREYDAMAARLGIEPMGSKDRDPAPPPPDARNAPRRTWPPPSF